MTGYGLGHIAVDRSKILIYTVCHRFLSVKENDKKQISLAQDILNGRGERMEL